jgi:hypothetical protein
MPADPVRRGAARTATVVAVPVTVVVLVISALVFGGFDTADPAPAATGPVTMTTRPLPPDTASLCRLVVSDLPETVAGHARRAVSAGAEQNAAYGDPPITFECGTLPPAVGETAEVFNLAPPGANAGVCWFMVDGDNRTLWTTVDREVPVTVTVPGPRAGSAQSVVPFSEAVGTNLPLRDADAIPSGCGANPLPS